MARRRKPGPRPTGLTVNKSFMLTPKASRELARVAREYQSEAHAIRAALDAFFLLHNVREMDKDVYSVGQTADAEPVAA